MLLSYLNGMMLKERRLFQLAFAVLSVEFWLSSSHYWRRKKTSGDF